MAAVPFAHVQTLLGVRGGGVVVGAELGTAVGTGKGVGVWVGIDVGAAVATVAQTKEKEVSAVPVTILTPVATRPLEHPCAVMDAVLEPNGPSVVEVAHSPSANCVMNDPDKP